MDPSGKRTIGVLTKPDLINPGGEAEVLEVLSNNRKPLKLGYVMVKVGLTVASLILEPIPDGCTGMLTCRPLKVNRKKQESINEGLSSSKPLRLASSCIFAPVVRQPASRPSASRSSPQDKIGGGEKAKPVGVLTPVFLS